MIQLDKHHIALYGVAIALSLGMVYFVESKVADRADAKYEMAVATAKVKDDQNAQFQAQIAQQAAQLATQNAQLSSQNDQLVKLVQQATQALQAQKVKDATLPPTDLANRIATLAPGGTVTVVAGGYQLDQTEAVSVAQTLEEPAALKQEISSKDAQISNDTTIIANDAKALSDEKQSHASDVTALKGDIAAKDAEITKVKADARRGKLKWFGVGYIAGFASSAILKVFVPAFTL